MAFEKGRSKTGGRQVGTPNKKSLEVEKIATELGVSPMRTLMLIASGDAKALGLALEQRGSALSGIEPWIPLRMRLDACKEICQYLYPKLKSVEITGAVGMTHTQSPITRERVLEALQMDPFTSDSPVGDDDRHLL